MINGYQFWNGPWHDVEWMLAETEKFYAENVTANGLGNRFSVTREKIIAHRKWQPSLALIEKNFDPILRELNIFYVPKQLDPGPCFIFPQRDLYERYTFGKINPLYDLVLKSGPVKYGYLGKKENQIGPPWFGNTDQTLLSLGRTRKVLIVEGFWDLFACRLLHPETPALSTGTKNFNDDHVSYLRMLGVEQVYLMFDNEAAKGEKELGAGNQAMAMLSAVYSKKTNLIFHNFACPNDDASLCLEHYRPAALLQASLQKIFPA